MSGVRQSERTTGRVVLCGGVEHSVGWWEEGGDERGEWSEKRGSRRATSGGGEWHRLVGYSLCMHSPSVQFLDCSTVPSQSFPPFLGAGAPHSLRLQWVHSVPQVDHLLHSVHRPSTTDTTDKGTDGEEAEVNEMSRMRR